MTLHSLQAATSSSSNDDDFVPPEDIAYEERLRSAGYGTEDIPDEFTERGWVAGAQSDSGGTPVTFGDDRV